MLRSSNSISCLNIHLNAAVTYKLEVAKEFTKALHNLIKMAIEDYLQR